MVDGLVDTSILIDCLRLRAEAQAWLRQQSKLGVSPVVWLEILDGAANRSEQRKAIKLLRPLVRVDPTTEDFEWSIRNAIRFGLSHGVQRSDFMIAATSHRLQIPLYTLNLKHFTPLLGALAKKPY